MVVWIALAATLTLGAKTAWLLMQSFELARRSEPLQRTPSKPLMTLLIVGDSTAVGTGASQPWASVAGLLAQKFPDLLIENRARDGAQFTDVMSQLEGTKRFDMVLIMAGANDVIRLRRLDRLRGDIDRATHRARQITNKVVLMPSGNVGNAPFFFVPLSWFMEWRSRKLHALVLDATRNNAAVYVNLFHERDEDPFVQRPELNAMDGLHPSDAGYQVWFRELLKQTQLDTP